MSVLVQVEKDLKRLFLIASLIKNHDDLYSDKVNIKALLNYLNKGDLSNLYGAFCCAFDLLIKSTTMVLITKYPKISEMVPPELVETNAAELKKQTLIKAEIEKVIHELNEKLTTIPVITEIIEFLNSKLEEGDEDDSDDELSQEIEEYIKGLHLKTNAYIKCMVDMMESKIAYINSSMNVKSMDSFF